MVETIRTAREDVQHILERRKRRVLQRYERTADDSKATPFNETRQRSAREEEEVVRVVDAKVAVAKKAEPKPAAIGHFHQKHSSRPQELVRRA